MIKSINAKAKRHKGGDNDGWTPTTGIVSGRLMIPFMVLEITKESSFKMQLGSPERGFLTHRHPDPKTEHTTGRRKEKFLLDQQNTSISFSHQLLAFRFMFTAQKKKNGHTQPMRSYCHPQLLKIAPLIFLFFSVKKQGLLRWSLDLPMV